MLGYRVRSMSWLKRLHTDQDGVVSFEYVVLAACVVGSVSAALGTSPTGAVATTLASAISAIGSAV
jgi:pilus assembly protein Flp/PilA